MISLQVAKKILDEASKSNPGVWVSHSFNVAKAAKIIAEHIHTLDAEKAYIYGLLHDIGRYNGISHLRHVYDGVIYMESNNFLDVAKICLTHSFPIKNIYSYSGLIDLTKEELDYLDNKLKSIEYDDYDRLIQFCDSIASHNGFCRVEVRIVDVAIRNGVNEFSIEKWKKFIELKEYFDTMCKGDVYELLNIY